MYLIVPKEGYSYHDLAKDGFDFKNAKIVRIRHGIVVEEMPYTPLNAERWKAKPHPDLFRAMTVHEKHRSITLPAPLLEGTLADGMDPFLQLIWLVVRERRGVLPEDIVNSIAGKYCKNTRKNREILEKYIEYMRRQGYLNLVGEIVVLGDRDLPIGNNRIFIEEGYNPIEYEIWRFCKRRPSRGDISRYMISAIRWIARDPVTGMGAEKKLDMYLKAMEREGLIRREDGKYRVLKPPERVG